MVELHLGGSGKRKRLHPQVRVAAPRRRATPHEGWSSATSIKRARPLARLIRGRGVFLLVMAAGSVVGTFIGGQLLGLVPGTVLLPALALILLVSAVKIWRHV